MPEEELVKKEGALPSLTFPSDHLRIEAILEFTTKDSDLNDKKDSNDGPKL
jgi:hypothetical protein